MSDSNNTTEDGSPEPLVRVARQPICDLNLKTFGYELLFRDSALNQAVIRNPDSATTNVIAHSLMEIGMERLLGSAVGFINVTRDFIVGGHCLSLPKDRIILEILEDVSPDPELLAELHRLRQQGFRFALDDFTFQENAKALLPFAEIVKVDLRQVDRTKLERDLASLRAQNRILLAEKVETREEHEFCKALGFAYFQGYFFCRPDLVSKVAVPVNCVQLLRLLAELNNPEIAPNQFAEIIAGDLSLSYKLLRYINSAYFNLIQKIESIPHAVQLVGLQHIRALASLMLMTSVDNKPKELVTVSLICAKMCELLAARFNCERNEACFSVGLLSALDAFLDCPMKQALESLPLSPSVREALLDFRGDLGRILIMVVHYEQTCLDRGRDSADIQIMESTYWQAVDWQSQFTKRFSS